MEQNRKQRGGVGRLRRMVGLVVLLAVCTGALVFSLLQIFTIQSQRNEARQEYDGLRQLRPGASSIPQNTAAPEETSCRLDEINPDYVGWLSIPGTAVDYPVVQGNNNEKYLYTTFDGTRNPAGSIFMDYSIAADFSARHTILYGHNMKDGAMFGGLSSYLNSDFLRQNPLITITAPDGGEQAYQIFAARQVLADDGRYRLSFSGDEDFAAFAASLGAPGTPGSLLTLSTCTNAGGDERILVHAVPLV